MAYWAAVELTPAGRRGLNPLMNEYRHRWMEQLVVRENRIVDTTILASLQNGTAFFASTSLIAVGGVLALFQSTDTVVGLFAELPFGLATTRVAWEVKVMGLAVVFVYAFFKFAWSYRLFNYVAILVGSVPVLRDDNHDEAFGRRAPGRGHERGGGQALQPRPARVLLRARLSRLVRERLCVHRRHGGGALCDVEAPVRLRCAGGPARRSAPAMNPPGILDASTALLGDPPPP
jgi:hypothetical protein